VTADAPSPGEHSAGEWAGRTVLVTGSGGFLGRRLVQTLARRAVRVLGLTQAGSPVAEPGVVPVAGDVRDIGTLVPVFRDHAVDVVFHLAALALPSRSRDTPLQAFDVNARGTWNLLEAARSAGAAPRVVLASTDTVYGESHGAPFTEAMQVSPGFPYEASKACAEIVARCYVATYGARVAIARFCNIYGPGDLTRSRLIVSTVETALSGQPQVLNGDGSAMRNYLYVDDAVEALTRVAEALHEAGFAGEVINICDDTPYSVLDVVRRVLDQTGRPDLSPILGRGLPGEISIKLASAAKARERLGWQAVVSLDEGLRRTIAWHRERRAGGAPG
jgi:nucleoside-diphosphate-sugar epimerase